MRLGYSTLKFKINLFEKSFNKMVHEIFRKIVKLTKLHPEYFENFVNYPNSSRIFRKIRELSQISSRIFRKKSWIYPNFIERGSKGTIQCQQQGQKLSILYLHCMINPRFEKSKDVLLISKQRQEAKSSLIFHKFHMNLDEIGFQIQIHINLPRLKGEKWQKRK